MDRRPEGRCACHRVAGFASFVLLIAVAALSPLSAPGESVRFEFNPPTPLSYVETVRTTRVTTGAAGEVNEAVTETRQKVELVGQADGYAMTVTPVSLKQIVGGREVDPPANPVIDLLTKAVFTYELDADGELQSMRGLEPVIEAVEEMIASALAEATPAQQEQMAGFTRLVESMLNPEALLARARGDWAARVSDFDGAEIEVGEALIGEEDFPLPNGSSIRYYNVLQLEELVSCGDRECARFVFEYTTDSEGMSEMLGEAFGSMPEVAIHGVSMSGGGERIVEPDTLLIRSETNERTITIDLSESGNPGTSGSRYEKREYRYDYGEASASR